MLFRSENEMNYVKDYIYLQKIRMDDNLSIEMKIDPNTYHDLIPKISIQTLVENSIIHGLSTTKSTIKISISITLESNKIKIVVRDNGSGIPLDTLEKLSNNFRQPLIPGSDIGIGLVNLNARLQLLYKEPATLSIQSEINSYTEITLLIPITIS